MRNTYILRVYPAASVPRLVERWPAELNKEHLGGRNFVVQPRGVTHIRSFFMLNVNHPTVMCIPYVGYHEGGKFNNVGITSLISYTAPLPLENASLYTRL